VAAQLERQAIEAALQQSRWNRIQAASALGMHPKTLGRKIKEQRLA
jgi:DNA-binding NtrC family response regulator